MLQVWYLDLKTIAISVSYGLLHHRGSGESESLITEGYRLAGKNPTQNYLQAGPNFVLLGAFFEI